MGFFTKQLSSSGLCRMDTCNNSERSSRRFIKTSEAPYQAISQRTLSTTLGHKELRTSHFWLSLLSECLSCYLYVFVVCSTRISWTGSIIGHEPNLLAMALSSGIAMMLLILTFRTVHVNPALTMSFLFTGRIPLIRALFYVLAHCIGAIAAIAFLYSIAIKGHAGALGLDKPHYELESWQILIVEIVISFVVTLVTYATCNYSSYKNARQFVLEQVAQHSDLFSSSTHCDNFITNNTNGTSRRPTTLTTSKPNLSNTSRRNLSSNFRVHPQSKGYLSDNCTEDTSDYDYEYDNHRIYTAAHQTSADTSPVNKFPPIEEMIQDECQLLAPNGFSLQMTNGQAFLIGLAYTLTSLSGIPASGASLNPARSFGPAFIMNRWERHWIYWLGPISGAIMAGFFYEFVFNPTKKSSLCYLPKLLRLSAHDMAKVGSRSRLYQQHQHLNGISPVTSATSAPIFPSSTSYRPQMHRISTIQHSLLNRHQHASTTNNLMNNSTMFPIRDSHQPQKFIPSTTTAASLAHLQSSHFAHQAPNQYQSQHQHDLGPVSFINQQQYQSNTQPHGGCLFA